MFFLQSFPLHTLRVSQNYAFNTDDLSVMVYMIYLTRIHTSMILDLLLLTCCYVFTWYNFCESMSLTICACNWRRSTDCFTRNTIWILTIFFSQSYFGLHSIFGRGWFVIQEEFTSTWVSWIFLTAESKLLTLIRLNFTPTVFFSAVLAKSG